MEGDAFRTTMARLNDEIIEELDHEGPRLEFVSLEDGKHQRLKYVGLSFTKLPECRCRARVEIERRAGQMTVASAEGPDSGAGKITWEVSGLLRR